MAWNANLMFRLKTKCANLLSKHKANHKQIPIILNNYNRLEYLRQLINWLQGAGYRNIYIIDNNSTYAPLLKYYNEIPYTIFKLNKNIGFLALWKTVIFTRFKNNYYVYSDADILPVTDCPKDFLLYFKSLLSKYNNIDKVGFALKTDDIPDHYPLKNNVIEWESKFWEVEIEKSVYVAPIDTTFALYKPGAKGGSELEALRTSYPYIARHLSWYINPDSLSEDEKYYQGTSSASASWTNKLIGNSTTPKY